MSTVKNRKKIGGFIYPTPEEEIAINKGIAADPDTFEATDEQFKTARRGRPFSDNPKLSVTLRLDREVVAHFKDGGKGWQSRINATLRKAAGV